MCTHTHTPKQVKSLCALWYMQLTLLSDILRNEGGPGNTALCSSQTDTHTHTHTTLSITLTISFNSYSMNDREKITLVSPSE